MAGPLLAEPSLTDWAPPAHAGITWSLLSVLITLASIPIFALPLLVRFHFSLSLTYTPALFLALILCTLSLVALHELFHAALMIRFGASPRFAFTFISYFLPAFYVTAHHDRFTKPQYLTIAAGPAVFFSILGLLLACLLPSPAFLVLPFSLHLGGCIGDAFVFIRVLGEPKGTILEDLPTGLRFLRPAVNQLAAPALDG
jgi:hypothetical protein